MHLRIPTNMTYYIQPNEYIYQIQNEWLTLQKILLKTRQDGQDKEEKERKDMLVYSRALLHHGEQFCFDLQFHTQ